MPSKGELQSTGFLPRATFPVALVYWRWRTAIQTEGDRTLRLAEETILRLLVAGVTDPEKIGRLMGIDDTEIVPATVANLMRQTLVTHHDGHLQVTPAGNAVLARRAMRQALSQEVTLFFDPYRQRASLSQPVQLLSGREVRQLGLLSLPYPSEPTRRDLTESQASIQRELRAATSNARELDVLWVVPGGAPEPAYSRADLEVWHHPIEDQWDWRLLFDGVEDSAATAIVRELEERGGDVVPKSAAPPSAPSTSLQRVLTDLFCQGVADDGPKEAVDPELLVVPAHPWRMGILNLLVELNEVGGSTEGGRPMEVWLLDSTQRGASEQGGGPSQGFDFGKQAVDAMRRIRGANIQTLGVPSSYGAVVDGDAAWVVQCTIVPVAARGDRGVPACEWRRVNARHLREGLSRELPGTARRGRG